MRRWSLRVLAVAWVLWWATWGLWPAPSDAKHKVLVGKGVWYSANGQYGACGVKLTGHYVAHRTLPCGTSIRIKKAGTTWKQGTWGVVKDRGPWDDYDRIVDMSPSTFKQLAPLSVGVIKVRVRVNH